MSAVMEEKTSRGLREIAVLAFFAVGVFFLVALVTFNKDDMGWTHSGIGQKVTNACGLSGAWLADFTFSFFGLCAFLFPVIVFWHGYQLYALARERQHKITTAFQWLGSIGTVVSSAALLYMYLLRVGMDLPGGTGGILGQETGDALLLMFGNSGATLFLIVLFLSGLTLSTDVSWLKLIDLVGKYTFSLFQIFSFSVVRAKDDQRYDSDDIDRPENFDVIEVGNDDESSYSTVAIGKVEKSSIGSSLLHSSLSSSKQQINYSSGSESKIQRPEIISPPKIKYKSGDDVLPALALLDERDTRVVGYSNAELEAMSRLVEGILADYKVAVSVVAFHPGPVITRFELQPAAGVKVNRISNLSKDLARALSVTSVRIVEIIPGKTVVGLEIPNREREMVTLKELLVSPAFVNAKSLLTLAMGKDISGDPLVADLGKMPHALVAGTTGSGKSVAINTMILSLLYKATPEEVRMIMIDPKMLELSVYEGIPHLLTPVVTDVKEASNSLRWAVAEMERRYKLMSKLGVRNLAGFNQKIDEATANGEVIRDPIYKILNPLEEWNDIPVLTKLPSIVIVIDELADMMMIVGKKVEELIARLAQKARAAGIHLILATQRPSVDVLTGLIKANIPTRISFQVSSRIDSRTILDQGGAEALLGLGDMLFLPSGTSIPTRVHGAFVDDHEVHRVVAFLKETAPPDYLDEITRDCGDGSDGTFSATSSGGGNSENDPLYDEAVMFVTETRKASISSVQRRFKVGYNRAATIIETMEVAGVVSPAETNGSRTVLAPSPVRD